MTVSQYERVRREPRAEDTMYGMGNRFTGIKLHAGPSEETLRLERTDFAPVLTLDKILSHARPREPTSHSDT